MSRKSKTPKFNSVLEDFRKFAGLKTAEEQGNREESVSYIPSEKDVKDGLPAQGQPFGSNVDPNANMGKDVSEKLPDQKTPSEESPQRKETSPSSKVAQEDEDLVNSLLKSISVAIQEDKKAEETVTEEAAPETTEEATPESKEEATPESKEEAAPESTEEAPTEEAKEASDDSINEDVLAEKIATHFRNTSVGYELGKFLFESLGQKVANEMVPVEQAPEEMAPAGDEGDEIAVILQAVQELVQEGQISEEQAQSFLMELEAAMQGGGEAPMEEAPMEEAPVEEIPEEMKEAMEKAVNEKVASLKEEGKTEEEIEQYLKEAAENDAKQIKEAQELNQLIYDFVSHKVAQAKEAGVDETQIEEYVKHASKNPDAVIEEIQKEQQVAQIGEMVDQKVASLKEEGKTEEEIEQYLKEAAENDAKLLQKEAIKDELLSKIAQNREQEKTANEEIPEQLQQILMALEELLQSGQITEEEAMAVLQELGVGGGEAPAGEAPAEGQEVPIQ